MEREPKNLKKLYLSSENRTNKNPCYVCIQFKDMINKQNQMITEMKADHKILREQVSKLQVTTVDQNKIIVEILAEHKIQLQSIHKTRQSITALTTIFPIKTEENLQKINADINETNEEKYISAVQYLLDGNAIKNLECILSRELCIMYNIDGICGKKSLKTYNNIYKTVIAAISHYSSNAEKEIRAALQVVKKRHFRNISAKKKVLSQTNPV